MGDFQRDTAVAARGGGYDCTVGADWQAGAGPNGGYLAAIVVRALTAASAAPEGSGRPDRPQRPPLPQRPLRSLSVQYLRAPLPGPARVTVTVEKAGRTVTFKSARLEQEGRTCALALGVLAGEREAVMDLDDAAPPPVPAPEAIEARPGPRPEAPPFGRHFDYRPAIGGLPFEGAAEALAGGWLRLRDDVALDAALVVALCDAWYPAAFVTTAGPAPVPTLDLTVHVRAPLPRPPGWVLGRFRTRRIRDGFLEEDAELWSPEGELLAQSRQLALAP